MLGVGGVSSSLRALISYDAELHFSFLSRFARSLTYLRN